MAPLAAARRDITFRSTALAFSARLGTNAALVVASRIILGGGSMDVGAALFFVLLLSLLVTLHDRWLPVRRWREQQKMSPGSSTLHGVGPLPGAKA